MVYRLVLKAEKKATGGQVLLSIDMSTYSVLYHTQWCARFILDDVECVRQLDAHVKGEDKNCSSPMKPKKRPPLFPNRSILLFIMTDHCVRCSCVGEMRRITSSKQIMRLKLNACHP